MPLFNVEFVVKGTAEISAPDAEYAQDKFYDSKNYDFSDVGDVEIVRIEKQDNYEE